jgi:hypothetical protein
VSYVGFRTAKGREARGACDGVAWGTRTSLGSVAFSPCISAPFHEAGWVQLTPRGAENIGAPRSTNILMLSVSTPAFATHPAPHGPGETSLLHVLMSCRPRLAVIRRRGFR